VSLSCCFEIIWNICTVVFAILLGIPNGACVWRWNHTLLIKQHRHEIVSNFSFPMEWTHMHSSRTIRLCCRYVCSEGFIVFTSDADSLFPLGGFVIRTWRVWFCLRLHHLRSSKNKIVGNKSRNWRKTKGAHRNDLYCPWFIDSSTSASESNNLVVQP